MSGIDRLLSAFDVQVEPFAICDVRSGWTLSLDRLGYVTVHYALSGLGRAQIGDSPSFDFGPNTIIIVPRGLDQMIETRNAEHCSTGEDDTECRSVPEGMRWLRAGDGVPEIVMACGRIRATYGMDTGIFDVLSEPIAESFAADHPIHHAFQALLAELSEPQLGSTALTEMLMKQCLVYVLRRMTDRGDPRLPWLSAAENPKLGAAVEVMLTQPEHGHSVEDLADIAGMSRSTFAAHFNQAFGKSPHVFLTERRLHRAAHYLETTELPIKTIAGKTGYRSRSNFSRAFKSFYGVDPFAYRQSLEEHNGVCPEPATGSAAT